jgi:2-polyprenyl-3-methyl-5-hydroxy-6-metoxy-1,4-benzoquinol methylase
MNSLQNLDSYRKSVAEKTKGTSDGCCTKLALKLLMESGAQGSFLEFGAGIGNLAHQLSILHTTQAIVCADILPRPPTLPEKIRWIQVDLNFCLPEPENSFDVIVSVEVLEHLENPRAVFREFYRLLKPGGTLVLTTPNQESLRSYLSFLFGGHFAAFLGASYPAHITALLRKDLARICSETGFAIPRFAYSGEGRIPKLTMCQWQNFLPFLRGRIFSDNFGLVVKK